MSDWAYYIVRSGNQIIGRHALAWPTECPPGVWRPLQARWYKAFPDATIERDDDQMREDTFTPPPDPFRRISAVRTLLRKALRKACKAEILTLLDEMAP